MRGWEGIEPVHLSTAAVHLRAGESRLHDKQRWTQTANVVMAWLNSGSGTIEQLGSLDDAVLVEQITGFGKRSLPRLQAMLALARELADEM